MVTDSCLLWQFTPNCAIQCGYCPGIWVGLGYASTAWCCAVHSGASIGLHLACFSSSSVATKDHKISHVSTSHIDLCLSYPNHTVKMGSWHGYQLSGINYWYSPRKPKSMRGFRVQSPITRSSMTIIPKDNSKYYKHEGSGLKIKSFYVGLQWGLKIRKPYSLAF